MFTVTAVATSWPTSTTAVLDAPFYGSTRVEPPRPICAWRRAVVTNGQCPQTEVHSSWCATKPRPRTAWLSTAGEELASRPPAQQRPYPLMALPTSRAEDHGMSFLMSV